MAVTPLQMELIARDDTDSGGVFHTKFVATSGTDYTTPYLLPLQPIGNIVMFMVGDGKLDFTASSYTDIETENAVWYSWDGIAEVNPGVTAFKCKRLTGDVTIGVTVKTLYAS
jgi:hypothetical protein